MVHRRVERLSEPAKRLVQAASVVGEGFSPKLLSEVIGLSEWAALDALEEAELAGLVSSTRFGHDLTRQCIYKGLADSRRKALHLRVAEKLEGSEPQIRAEHWFEGGETTRASALWQKTADSLKDLGLHKEAISTLERALKYAPDFAAQSSIRKDLIVNYHGSAEYQKALEIIESTLAQSTDTTLSANLKAFRLQVLYDLGKVEESLEIIDDLLSNIDGVDDEEIRLDIYFAIATAYSGLGRYEEALAFIQSDVEHNQKSGPSARLASSLSSLGSLYDHLAQHQTALKYHQQAIAMAKNLNARGSQVATVQNLLYCLAQLGRSEEGIAPAQEALELGWYARSDVLRNNLAVILQRLGRLEDSIPHFEYLATDAKEPLWRAVSQARLAEVWAVLGHSDKVIPALNRAIQLLEHTDLPFAQGVIITRVLLFGSPDQIDQIRPILKKLNPETLNPVVRTQLAEAMSKHGLSFEGN